MATREKIVQTNAAEIAAAKQAYAQAQAKAAEAQAKTQDTALRAAAVDTGGSGESTRKIYRRADLIKLRMTDPDRYMSLQDEILAAYNEGRVK